MARKKQIKLGGLTAKTRTATEVNCECTKQVTPRTHRNCECFVIGGDGPLTVIRTDVAKLLKVDKLQTGSKILREL